MNILIYYKGVIPAITYGGTQRDIWALGKELVTRGHKVTFLVLEGSKCPFAEVIYIDSQKSISSQIPEGTDITNIHSSIVEEPNFAYLSCIHGNPRDNDFIPQNTVFVSKNQAERYHSKHFIYNGIDWDLYDKPDLNNKRANLHFLGKAAWKIKNLKASMYIAKKAGYKLDVLGGYRFNLKMGIRITLDPRIRFHGMVDNKYKSKILNKSNALLFPVLWHEPMGLAVIESLYFGCPVFATPYGSLPELVGSEFGFLSNKADELIEAVKNLSSYDRKKCHEYARDCFNPKVMTDKYLDYFEKILNNQVFKEEKPYTNKDIQISNLPFYY